MPYLTIIALAGSAVFFYQAGESEEGSGLLWGALSVVISLLALRYAGLGCIGLLLGQLALLVGIGLFRAMRKS